MGFLDSLTNFVEKEAKHAQQRGREILRSKSDAEIRRWYLNMDNNPDMKPWARDLLIEEAHRRGIH